jgi:hypothetical protein
MIWIQFGYNSSSHAKYLCSEIADLKLTSLDGLMALESAQLTVQKLNVRHKKVYVPHKLFIFVYGRWNPTVSIHNQQRVGLCYIDDT